MSHVPGLMDLKLFTYSASESRLHHRPRAGGPLRINVADIQDAVQTAVGGNAVSQVLLGEERYDVVVRYQAPYRDTAKAIANIRLLSPSGERVSLAQLTHVEVKDGAYDIYREGNTRYDAVTFNVRGRDLGSTVEDAMKAVSKR